MDSKDIMTTFNTPFDLRFTILQTYHLTFEFISEHNTCRPLGSKVLKAPLPGLPEPLKQLVVNLVKISISVQY